MSFLARQRANYISLPSFINGFTLVSETREFNQKNMKKMMLINDSENRYLTPFPCIAKNAF